MIKKILKTLPFLIAAIFVGAWFGELAIDFNFFDGKPRDVMSIALPIIFNLMMLLLFLQSEFEIGNTKISKLDNPLIYSVSIMVVWVTVNYLFWISK